MGTYILSGGEIVKAFEYFISTDFGKFETDGEISAETIADAWNILARKYGWDDKLSVKYGKLALHGKKMVWKYDDSEPNGCCGCKEPHNGLNYARICIGKARFWITACNKCKALASQKD